ncbi:TrbG/VirB9 family P-type conjugative transfer protein [Novosphingobium sp. Leaf2]|uniref:TrbG/VirB9 family P-type conjugative transfer protein n=1 Tax=Novosphingobium sp. Leaf2 TaxID=1735670 RepID=UPI0006FCFE84|nr:TrbG/VirB9 family P-type conjugative transfer protein [Novosphingobium sp. Leaf2]KQM18946.1 type VI secretion protein [Novosphingobium sp. Leaf2]
MIRAPLRTLALAGCIAAIAVAGPAQADERLLSHAYNANEVVRIDGKAGVQATIAFGDGEAIENVAVGDSQAWQITPNKRADLLFVKPLEATARTNMTVVTNRHTYFFDLVASAKARPLYMLRFTYKDAPKPASALANAPLSPAEQALAAGDAAAVAAAVPADPAALNFAWKRVGMEKLMPARVYDDGSATYLLWPEKSPVPAILVTNEKGDEGPVNYAVRGATIVIDDVPDVIVLRSGKAVARLVNSHPLAARPAAVPAASVPSAPAPTMASASPAASIPPSTPTVEGH